MEILSRDNLIKLAKSFEASSDVLAGMEGQVVEGIAHWELPDYIGSKTLTDWEDWFNTVGYSGVYFSYFNDTSSI